MIFKKTPDRKKGEKIKNSERMDKKSQMISNYVLVLMQLN